MMRRRQLAVLLSLLAAALPLAGAQTGGDCSSDEGTVTCTWRVNTVEELLGAPDRLYYFYDLPVLPTTYASLTITLSGRDAGWHYFVIEDLDGDRSQIQEGFHSPSADAQTYASETRLLFFETRPGATYELQFAPSMHGLTVAGGQVTDAAPTARSVGSFILNYAATALPPGEPPARPAATREDPHLVAFAGDAPRGGKDITAVWFDDELVGDGAFETHIAVADLTDWGWPDGSERVIFLVLFTLSGQRYEVNAAMDARGQTDDVEDVSVTCGLSIFAPEGETSLDTRGIVDGICRFDWEASEITVVVPERAVGSPADGARFTDMRASSHTDLKLPFTEGYSSAARTLDDEVSGERYPFALGGPPVWDELNPRLALAAPVVPPWYQAPLHSQNVPDTLQVLGALVAVSTFLFGLIIVRRHRRQTRELLARIDELMAAHEREARAGLLALGTFETEITKLYHENRLNDNQYQVLTQRISGAAARFALRHGLGLDDGAPGDARPRRIPIQTEPPSKDAPTRER